MSLLGITLEHSPELDKLGTDLSLLQGELPHIAKDSKGYGYNYSDLASTLDTVKPLLVKYGFSITQFEDGGKNLVTMLLHKSGQYIKGRMALIDLAMKGTNEAQSKGAVLSYFRRYSIQAILGMAAEDTDAATKDGAPASSRTAPSAQSYAAPKAPAPAQVSTSPSKEVSGDLGTAKRSFRSNKPAAGSEDL